MKLRKTLVEHHMDLKVSYTLLTSSTEDVEVIIGNINRTIGERSRGINIL